MLPLPTIAVLSSVVSTGSSWLTLSIR